MPLSGDALGMAIKAAIDAVGDKTDRDAVFKAMGGAIVTYLQANGDVSFTAQPVGPGLATPPGGGAVAGALTVTLGKIL